jgi:hypothetical protein
MEAKIIIVGGRFAGVTLAERLSGCVSRDVEVVVISSDNHMVFTPMLAEVVGRSLSGLNVVVPGRQIAPRATWLTATVVGHLSDSEFLLRSCRPRAKRKFVEHLLGFRELRKPVAIVQPEPEPLPGCPQRPPPGRSLWLCRHPLRGPRGWSPEC